MSEAPPPATTPKTSRRAWRRLCFLAAAAILLVATPLSLSQDPAPDPLRPPELLSLQWWLLPIEVHARDRLPWVDADLLDVAAAVDATGAHVIAVGRKGTIIASDDGGRTWRRETARARIPATSETTPAPVPDYGETAPAGADPKTQPARPDNDGTAPRPDPKAPKPPETKPAKAARLLEWLVPSAHAIESPPNLPGGEAARQQPPEAGELQPASDDLVALLLESWPDRISAMAASGNIFARHGAGWVAAGYQGGAPATVLTMARRPPLRLLSTGDMVAPGSSQRQQAPRLPLARSVRSTDDGKVLAIAGNRVFRLGRNSWQPLGQPAPAVLRGLHFHDADRGWAVGEGLVFRTTDGGQRWTASETTAPVSLNALFFLPGGQRGWIVGNDGYVAETADGGARFLSRTRPRVASAGETGTPVRLPPPWYALSWLAALGLFFLGRSIPATREGTTELAVAPAFSSDRPLERGDPDVLNLNGLAAGLSRFLRNEATRPPLTIAVTGIWGTGKSSLMNLLRSDLRSFGFHPVWFNAWHHQSEEHLLASMLQSIRLQAIPSWWRIEGLLFRVHLLLLRGRKHALLLLALLAVTGLLIASESASGRTPDLAGTWKLIRAWISFFIDPTQKEPGESFQGLYLAKVGTLLALGVSVLRGLRAFGLNPGTLLAGAAGSIRMSDLEAKTSFRERFRAEYAEVTQALGPRKLIIFIDDLDRCQPKQVMEVLESVNFLVTSGECFVILGMDRERVVPCVALTFKDIAAELSRGDDDAEARKEYANQYLDKLINIEVPVPTLNASDAEKLLAPEPPPPAEEPSRGMALGRGLRELAELLRPGFRFWPLLVAAAVLFGGYAGGRMLGKGSAPPAAISEASGGARPEVARPPATEKGLVAGSTEQSAVALAIAAEIAGRGIQTGRLVPPGSGGSFPVGLVVVALLAAWMLFLLIQIAQLRPETVVRDSSEFAGALKAWRTLIFKSAATPRALRRFQNRVRFLSMRQRRAADERSWWRRTTELFKQSAEVKEEVEVDASIPESTLVALAAIYQTHPELLENPLTVEQARTLAPPPPPTLTDPAVLAGCPWNPQALAAEVASHRDQFLYRVRGFRVR